MNAPRNHGIDTLRGIGLAVVIIAHAGFETQMQQWGMFVFAMPLFYLAAGIFYKEPESLVSFIRDKCRRLIVPFIFFALAGLALYYVGNCLLVSQPFKSELFNLFSGDRYYLPYPASLWFFFSIFWCYLLYTLARMSTRNDAVLGVIAMGLGAVGWTLSEYCSLPLYLDTALSWLPFFYVGNMIGRHEFGKTILSGKYWYICLAIVVVSCVINSINGYVAGYCYNIFIGSIPMIILLNLSGTVGLAAVCCRIGEIPLLSYIGKNSLVIFAAHQHFMIIIQQLAQRMGATLDWVTLGIITIVLATAASIALSILLRRYAPWAIGLRPRPLNLSQA